MREGLAYSLSELAQDTKIRGIAEHLTVLLVESDPFHSHLVEARLEYLSEGRAQVVHVGTFAAALLALERSSFDAVLINPFLADCQGLDTVVMLLQQALDTPLVVLCDTQSESLALEALQFGAQDHIAREKLIEENVYRVVRHAIQRHSLNWQIERQMMAVEATRRRFQSVVEDNADGMVVVDHDGIVCYANPAAYTLMGRQPDTLVGNFFGLPIEGGDISEVDILRPGQDSVVADIRVMETNWDGRPAFIANLRDVTTRKTSENTLRATTRIATKAARVKSEFLARMSHELRTPLNAIIGFSELMQMQVFGPVGDPRYNEYLRIINASGCNLLSLVGDLLDLSKAEAGKLDLMEQRCDLGAIISNVISEQQLKGRPSGSILVSNIAPHAIHLWADPQRVTQALAAIVHNGLKFSGKNGEVRISGRQAEDGGYMVVVDDTGPGLHEDQVDRVFSAFAPQDDPYVREPGQGAGLGLAIARRMLELHQSGINFESLPGWGTRVTVRFPQARILPAGGRPILRLVSG